MNEPFLKNRPARLGILAVIILALALAAGPEAWGRLALRANLPKLAAALLADSLAKAVAQLQSGDAETADLAFASAGAEAAYDRAASLAARGQYDLAVAYYDAVLFVDPHDEDAIANRAVIARFASNVVAPPDASRGHIAATATKDGPSLADPYDASISAGPDQRRTLRPVTAQSMQAGESWLATVSDSPGEYLKKILAAEYDRRVKAGLIVDGGQ